MSIVNETLAVEVVCLLISLSIDSPSRSCTSSEPLRVELFFMTATEEGISLSTLLDGGGEAMVVLFYVHFMRGLTNKLALEASLPTHRTRRPAQIF